MNLFKGAMIATAVAGLYACGGSGSTAKKAEPAAAGGGEIVQCAGINSCKGQGNCAGNENACKAQNECKGKGWVETSKSDCNAKGGTVRT